MAGSNARLSGVGPGGAADRGRRAAALLSAAAVLMAMSPAARAWEVSFDDPLMGSTTGNQSGGAFTDQGWQAPTQIWWTLPAALIEGGMSIELVNWNPAADSPQHKFDKQHIINMYQMPHGSPHESDSDAPKTAFFNVRTGAGYDNHFKFLSSTGGFDERIETRVKCDQPCIDPAQVYTLRIEWTVDGAVSVFQNDVHQVTHEHGKSLLLQYVFIGTDNAPAGTYGPQHDVIYRNLHVWGNTGAPPDNPDPDTSEDLEPGQCQELLFEPAADAWVDPGNPAVNHGADPELRVGGDGRTIFLRFDLSGLGQVLQADLSMKVLNAGGGGSVHQVQDSGWTEAGITWNNQPSFDAQILASLGKVEIEQVVHLDLTTGIAGNGVHAFAISSTDQDGSGYHSREAADQHPVLKIVSCGAPVQPGDMGPDTADVAVAGDSAWEIMQPGDNVAAGPDRTGPDGDDSAADVLDNGSAVGDVAGPDGSQSRTDSLFYPPADEGATTVIRESGCNASARASGLPGLLLLVLALCAVAGLLVVRKHRGHLHHSGPRVM